MIQRTSRLTLLLFALSLSTQAETPKSVSAALTPFVQKHELAGAVTIVATADKVLDTTTVGFSDIAAQRPMQPDAMFWIASMSKPITAAALMTLVDERKVSLDDHVEKFIPEFKGQLVQVERDDHHATLRKPAHPITVRNILCHTSGLAFKSVIEQPTLDMIPLSTAALSHAIAPLQFEPDRKYQYANAGINIAGRIIEIVSGMSYEAFLQQRLFDPLAMKDTTFWPSEAQLTRLAKAYKPNATKDDLEETLITQLHYPLNDRARQPMPGGGLFSTASDCVTFCQMLLNKGKHGGKTILSERSITAMTTRQTRDDLPQSYGLGLQITPEGFGHGGAYATNMSVDVKHGLVTVFMVQHAGFPGQGKDSGGAFKQAALQLAPR